MKRVIFIVCLQQIVCANHVRSFFIIFSKIKNSLNFITFLLVEKNNLNF